MKMKKKYTSYEEAESQYTAYIGTAPEMWVFIDLYHRYRNEWKHFNDFLEWLIYNV